MQSEFVYSQQYTVNVFYLKLHVLRVYIGRQYKLINGLLVNASPNISIYNYQYRIVRASLCFSWIKIVIFPKLQGNRNLPYHSKRKKRSI